MRPWQTLALKLAREVCPLTPVVIISGSLGEEEAVKSLQFGATDYLLKGHLERLLPAVQRALEEARERRNRQQAEAELRQNEERMRLALAATNDGIWDTNDMWSVLEASAADAPKAGEFLNRDLSWLEFNRRVLAMAVDERTPLLERVRFLGIFTSNLDEYVMKRAASLRKSARLGATKGPTPPPGIGADNASGTPPR